MYSFEKIINEPVNSGKFYTPEMIYLLNNKLFEIYELLNIKDEDRNTIINIVLNYVKTNVRYNTSYFDCFTKRKEKFDYENIKYRTAYAALVEGEATCAGYAEALRILLDLYNIESYTLLSKLPLERKKLLHYVVVVHDQDKNCFLVLDPESEQYCERKGYDYTKYIESSIFMIPHEIFTNDLIGDDGAGILAKDYVKCSNIPRVTGSKDISKLIDIKYNSSKILKNTLSKKNDITF